MRFFRKQDHGLEDRLRSLGSQPRDEFVRELSTEVRSSRTRTGLGSRRALAAALTSAALLIPFAAFGGIGYAAQAAKSAAQSISGGGNGNSQSSANSNGKGSNGSASANANGVQSSAVSSANPADDQYKPGKGCGDKNHIHQRENECKKPPK